MSPEKFSNVLMIHYIGTFNHGYDVWESLSAELYTLCIGLDMFLISDNCDIFDGRPPPLKRNPSKSVDTQSARLMAAPWNGIIFGNGTVIDNPPPGFHYGRSEILRNGYTFANGTFLASDIPNPYS